MKKILLFGALVAFAFGAQAQDLPTNPEPGKCYVRCTTPDIYETQTIQKQNTPAYKKLRVVPAQYETKTCLLYTSPSPRDRQKSRMPSSA